MEDNKLFIVNEEGVEEEFEIILTFTHPDTGVNYVVYKELTETDDVYAATYEETSDVAGSLQPVESEEEFDMIQDIIDAFFQEQE